ncbi:MAG: hypothetical protein QGF30_02510 [Alphaproteobacteria bacterium]|jgi:hypothetical protein|nr:hypothetical protein [Alphaproteobacteria bacterium]MDP6781657.1 hypothetical protein [Alphaproteobacteria bacterium]|tara:strand:- start:247 stop:396 length:150 start_codon:yes stop_codon:yes gene_type:complete
MPEKGKLPTKIKTTEKQVRLANALRENLRRRKARERGKSGDAGKKTKAP